MKKSRFTEEQIISALKEHERGGACAEICRRLGVTAQTFYRWKAKYGGMEVSQARRLREVEEENRRLKHIVAEQALDIRALKDVVSRKW